MTTTGVKLRGNTVKYLPVFKTYVDRWGADAVKRVLKTGRYNNLVLKLPINAKDRNQILRQLGI
uniref:Uncharacterized protein n=1 Tax=viral metagenome TaxID=1070528 RepID=A0A6H1ZTT6_9ZZZZ